MSHFTIAYIDGRKDVRTYVRRTDSDSNVITKIFRIYGLPKSLVNGAPRARFRRAELSYKIQYKIRPLQIKYKIQYKIRTLQIKNKIHTLQKKKKQFTHWKQNIKFASRKQNVLHIANKINPYTANKLSLVFT